MNNLEHILSNCLVDDVWHTHTSMINPKGKYVISSHILSDFWNAYNSTIETNTKQLGITEKSTTYIPILVDVDLKKKDGDDCEFEYCYTKEIVEQLISIYQSILRDIVDNCTDTQLMCVFLSKKPYRIRTNGVSYIKHGFHLHFPNLFIRKIDQEVHLIPRVKKTILDLNLFGEMGFENTEESIDRIVDKASCKNPWLMYGSKKDVDMDSYVVDTIYTSDGAQISIQEAFQHYVIYDVNDQKISIEHNIVYFLPQILSIIPYHRHTSEIRQGIVSPLKAVIRKQNFVQRDYNSVEIQTLLSMLAPRRSEEYSDWMTIGWTLYNIFGGTNEGLNLWCEFSSVCVDKYNEESCIYSWERMTYKDLTVGTLKHYAKIDNPAAYQQYLSKGIKDTMQLALLDGTHRHLAEVLYKMFSDQYIFSSHSWYKYDGICKWCQIEDGIYLRNQISETLALKYEDMSKMTMMDLGYSPGDPDQQALYNSRIKQAVKIVKSLGTTPFKSNVMKEAADLFYNEHFARKLDTDPYLIAFKNGVYDLKLDIFRLGRPEDFLSRCMPIEYKEFRLDDNEVIEVYKFFEQVFPDRSVRTYFLDMSSDVFVGGNHQKVVLFWTGEGDNGKSVTQSFFEQMLGPLAIKLPTTLFTGKKVANGAADPSMSRARGGVRWATLEEPDDKEVINIGVLKNLSGNDSIAPRDLFQKGTEMVEFTPMFKMNFICNKLPPLGNPDKASFNRIRVIPFDSTFCKADNPAPETYEEQLLQKRFPMDKNFSKKIPLLVEAFAWILLKHRAQLTVRIEPERVTCATNMYKRQNDIYRQYVDENIEIQENATISLTELYNNFKEWFKDSMVGQAIPIKINVKEYFTRLWGDLNSKNKWVGFKIRENDEDLL